MKHTLHFLKRITPMLALAVMMMAPILGWGQATLPVSTTTMNKDALPTGFTQSGLGTNYTGPHLKFDTQGDWLVLFFDATPGDLSFELGVNNTFPGTIPSGSTFSLEESTNGFTWTNVSSYSNVAGGLKEVSTLNSATRYVRWIYTTKPSGTNIAFRNVDLAKGAASGPTISTPNPTSLSGFSTVSGTASDAQTFTISGTNLTADIVMTAPTDYEVRENGSGSYGSSVSFTPSSGTVTEKTIQVRIASAASVGTPSGNVVCSSTDATLQNVAVSGTVYGQIDWCNVQSPANGTINLGGDFNVYAQVYEPGITNSAGQGAGITAWIGYGSSSSDLSGYTWILASYNTDVGNNDEYMANIGTAISPAGTYYYASRFQLGSSPFYVYGGYNSGFWDGTTNVSGTLTVNPAPTLDYVNLQSPANGDINVGGEFNVYAQVYEAGLTEAAGQGAGISAWIGYNTTNTNPNTWTNWVPATYNTDAGNNDEYMADIATGLPAGTYYYASRFKYGLADYVYGGLNGFWDESTSISGVLTVTTPEPSTHVTAFGATANSSSTITVSWTDSDADYYLIKGSDVGYSSITAPSDGTAESDGALVKNIASSIGTYQFTGLTSNTPYYFKIYPYNGTGADVNYKTDGSVPEATATTDEISTLLLVEDFDYADLTVLTTTTAVDPTTGWAAHNGNGTQNIDVTVPGLSFNGYVGSGKGGAARVDNNGQDINKTFTPQTSGSLYAAFVISANSTNSAGYFFHLAPDNILPSSFVSRVWINATGTSVGIGTGSSVAISANTPTLLVVKYNIDTKLSSLYVLNSMSATEPATANATFQETLTLSDIGAVCLRQYNASQNILVDGIRVTTSWADLVMPTSSTFTGTGNWSTGTWSNGMPTASMDAIINGDVTIDDVVECKDLTISPNGTVTAGVAGILDIKGDLFIQSDAGGTGSLIGNENTLLIGGISSIQRYISGASEAWHLLSSPVASQSISGDFTPSGTYDDLTGYDFYGWDEPTEYWMNRKETGFSVWNGGTNNFNVGQGYLVAYQATNPTKTFTGALNTDGIYSSLLTISGTQSYKHSNLLGNPFPSSIDWKSVGLDKSNLSEDGGGYNIYIYNQAYNNYGVYNDVNTGDEGTNGTSRYIAPMQGFFVIAASAGEFIFLDDAQVHSTQAWLKSGNDNAFRLSVTAPESAGKDEILIDFGHEASQGGADKWYSMSATAPALYANTDERDYSIRFLTTINDNPIVPVAFKAGVDGEYSIQANFNTASFSSVKLMDKATGNVQDLNSNPFYAFTATTGDDANRFDIVFGTLGIDKPTAADDIQVYAYGDVLYVTTSSTEAALVNVYNLTGQLVMQGKTGGNTLSTFNASALSNGVYVVSVISNQGVVSQKVVVRK